jgi:hypothetical protein
MIRQAIALNTTEIPHVSGIFSGSGIRLSLQPMEKGFI